jgi:hypothetical protein
MSVNEPKEAFLEADKEIPGQHYVCLSFISPNKVLKNKDVFFFSEFLKDYEIQYKVRATETFVMAEVAKIQSAASALQDVVETVRASLESKLADAVDALAKPVADGESPVDVAALLKELRATVKSESEKANKTVADARAKLSQDAAAALEAHVKAEMKDFKETTIQDAYDTFLYKQKKRLEDDFFAKNEFRTTVQGLKIRGVYDTHGEATARAKALHKVDSSFNVYVGQVGFWLPWDPEPHEVSDQEYADSELNTLMKKYKENESQRDEFFAQTKAERLAGAKVRNATIGENADAKPVGGMFEGEDLALARKREQNTISHA